MSKLKDLYLRARANVICQRIIRSQSQNVNELQAIKLATQGENQPLMSVDPDRVIKIDPKVFKELFGVEPVRIAKRIKESIYIEKQISRYLDTKEEN